MDPTLVFHITAGSIGIASGYVALFASKGAPVHRRFGLVFVAVMLAMTASGAVLAVARNAAPTINLPAALLTATFVTTAFTTVRPPTPTTRRVDRAALVVTLVVAAATLANAFAAVANGGTLDGMPAFPYFLFGGVGLLAGVQDLRVLRAGPPTGPARLRRHLWRMCFALFVAAMSFFLGQADEFPKEFRIYPLLALPGLTALGAMAWWLWRLRSRRRPPAGVETAGVRA